MTKKTMSQNKLDKDENPTQPTTSNSTAENLTNSNKNKRKLHNKNKVEYTYFTPKKKVKLHRYIPSTPKKKKRTYHYEDLPIVGKNLLDIFESL